MDNLSKVIFTCLAICITLLVYQNTQLNNDVDTLKNRIETLENPYERSINEEDAYDKDVYDRCVINFLVFAENIINFDDSELEEFCINMATSF